MKKNRFLIVIICILLLMTMVFPKSIRLEDYQPQIDYGTLTTDEAIVFDEILKAVKQGRDIIEYNGEIKFSRIYSHLGLYYGTMESIVDLFKADSTHLFLNLEVFKKFELNKVVVESRMEEALFNFKEGSDRFKLWQIACYISKRIKYDMSHRETVDGLNGKGVCSTYAMLFYKMASRLGIKVYICYGYAKDGGYHAWNRVILNGDPYYYDVTFFDDVVHNYRYIHNRKQWGRTSVLNDVWDGEKRGYQS